MAEQIDKDSYNSNTPHGLLFMVVQLKMLESLLLMEKNIHNTILDFKFPEANSKS